MTDLVLILGVNQFNSNGIVTVSKLKVTLLCHYHPNAIIYATQRCNAYAYHPLIEYKWIYAIQTVDMCSVRGKETGGGRRSNQIFPHSQGSTFICQSVPLSRDILEVNFWHLKIYFYMLNCKINSTNRGTFSKSAEKIIFNFFLFQGASVMSKQAREYKILKKSHPKMSKI